MKIIIAFFAFLLIPFSNFSQIQAGFAFDDSICVGDCIFFQDTSVGVVTSYSWSFGGGTPATSTAANPGPICFTAAGTYNIDLGIIGPDGPSTVSHTILVGNYMDSMDVSNDTLIEMGGAAYLAANGFPGGGTYNWIPNDIFECPNCPETVGSPLIPTNAIVQYISPEGCAIQDTIFVGIDFKDVIDVPNSFSPDDNGVNDKVYLKGPGIVTMTFRIFDRYGQKMFETSNQSEGWDGTFNGRKLPPATFAWTAEYSLIGGLTGVKAGTITLIK